MIYEPIDQMLRKKATEERERLDAQIATRNRARSKTPLERPQVIFVDDVPVYGQDPRTNTRSRRDAGYFVLVVAELHWEQVPVSSTRANRPADQNGDTAPSEPETTWTTLTKLRLLRVMASSSSSHTSRRLRGLMRCVSSVTRWPRWRTARRPLRARRRS